MAKYTVHAGHAPHGKLGAGAVGYCSESLIDRKIKDSVINWLRIDGHIAIDCTYEKAGTQSGIISAIKKKINAEQNVQANISIHLNALPKKTGKDNKTTGTECWVYPNNKSSREMANRIVAKIAALGFKSRGVKESTSLGVLKGIKNGGANVLVECFFCNDYDDYILFTKLGAEAIGKAIAEGIIGHNIGKKPEPTHTDYIYNDLEFGTINLAYVFDPKYYANNNKDLLKEFGSDNKKLLAHFISCGMKEGRLASNEFNINIYKRNNKDLVAAYGEDLPRYYKHYCFIGHTETRIHK